jgi:hypothetical protein
MYLDKDMSGHNLMQAIARVNRVFATNPEVWSWTMPATGNLKKH